MTPVRILIADDHEVVRHGLRALLERQPGWIVSGEASTGREAVAKAVDLRPDVVVLDVSMPELNGLEATRQIRRAVPARILILTVHESDQVGREVLDAGAHGYVVKADAGRTLVDAIRALLEHQEFFTERVHVVAARRAGRRRPGAARRGSGGLTPREREVLQLLTEGRTNKEIGTALGMTTKTAETHRTHIMAKLDLHSMSERCGTPSATASSNRKYHCQHNSSGRSGPLSRKGYRIHRIADELWPFYACRHTPRVGRPRH